MCIKLKLSTQFQHCKVIELSLAHIFPKEFLEQRIHFFSYKNYIGLEYSVTIMDMDKASQFDKVRLF